MFRTTREAGLTDGSSGSRARSPRAAGSGGARAPSECQNNLAKARGLWTRTSPVGTGSRPGSGMSVGYSKRPKPPIATLLPSAAAQLAASWRAASGDEPDSINRFVIADPKSEVPAASANCFVKLSTRSSFLLRSSFGFRILTDRCFESRASFRGRASRLPASEALEFIVALFDSMATTRACLLPTDCRLAVPRRCRRGA